MEETERRKEERALLDSVGDEEADGGANAKEGDAGRVLSTLESVDDPFWVFLFFLLLPTLPKFSKISHPYHS